MTGITYFAQRSADAGPGGWHNGVNSMCCFLVAALAWKQGRHNIKRSDLIAFFSALAALPLWYVTQQPLIAVIVIIGIENFAYYPTFRKSYFKPREEMAFAFALDAVRNALSIAALASYSLTTLLYPVYIVLINLALVSMLFWRRYRLISNS